MSGSEFERFFQLSSDLLCIAGTDGFFKHLNPAFPKHLGYPEEELKAKPFLEFVHADDRERTLAEIASLAEGKPTVRFENRYRMRDGSWCWLEWNATPLASEGRIYAIARDITNRRTLEEELRRQRDLAEGMIETAQAIVLVLDTDGRIVRYNRFLEDLTGVPLADVRGRDWFETFLPEQDHGRIRELFGKAITTERTKGNVNPILDRNGGEHQISWWDRELHDAYGKLIGLLCVGHDITERIRVEEELRRVNTALDEQVRERTRQLEAAQEELVRREKLAVLGQLAGSVAHEMRNPLGAIGNSVYYLSNAEEDLTADSRDCLDDIEREVATANRIVGELLDYARPPVLEYESTTCSALVDEAVRLLDVPEGIELELDIAGPCALEVDRGQMVRVLHNLMLNAIQAMEGRGRLKVRCVNEHSQAVFTVADNGPGILPESREKLFEPLFSTKAKGIGLGLPLSRRYAELNGGSLDVDLGHAHGAVFRLALPARQPRSSS